MHTQGFIIPQFLQNRPNSQKGPQWSRQLSQRALRGRARARHTGALPKGGKVRGVATNVYLWKTSEKPKETGQNENSKFGSCIYA